MILRWEKARTGEHCGTCRVERDGKMRRVPLEFGIELVNGRERITKWRCPECHWSVEPSHPVPAANNRTHVNAGLGAPSDRVRKL